jgi:fibronectin-binding autotransporter adhesin
MKSKLICLAPLMLIHVAPAADIVWDAGPLGTGTDWTLDENWVGDVTPVNSASTDNAFFTTLTAGQPTLDVARSIAGVELNTATGGWTLGGIGTLTLGAKGIDAGIFENGTNTISVANIVMASASAANWALSVSANSFTQPTVTHISSNIQLHPSAQLQFQSPRGGTGGTGTVNLSGTISNADGEATSGQVKYLGGSAARNTFNVTGSNSYTGNTLVSQAVVNFNSLANDGTPSALGKSGFINVTENSSFSTLVFNGTSPASTDRRLTIGLGLVGNAGAATVTNNATDPLHTLSFTGSSSIINGGSGNRQFVLNGSNTGNNTFAQSIDNAPSGVTIFTKQNPGRWLLTHANSNYTGATTLAGGFLGVVKLADGGSNSSIGASTTAATNLVFNGGELTYNGSGDSTDRLMTFAAGGNIRNNGAGALAFTNTDPISHTNTNSGRVVVLGGNYGGVNTFSPLIVPTGGSGTVGVRFENTTIWELTGANTYTGVTTINFGAKAQITSDANLGAAIGTGQLIIAGTLICNESLTLNSSRGIYAGSPTAAGSAIIQVAGDKTVTHDGIISDNLGGSAIGADGLSKTGPGILSLGAANTYTGTTTVFEGTLKLAAAGSFASSPTISVRMGAVLDLTEKTSAFPIASTQTLTGTGSVQGQSLEVLGNIAPGNAGIGTLSTGTVAMTANSTLTIQIDSAAATSATLAVAGDLTIGADALLVTDDIAAVAGIIPGGTKLTLATCSGTLSGTFKDLPEGSDVTVGGNSFTLSYADGNAITLTSANATDAYAEWIGGFPSLTNPDDRTKSADPDNDGFNNAIEFLIGGDPTSFSDQGRLWVGTSGSQLVLSLAIRGESTDFSGTPSPSATVEGIECRIQGSLDLLDFTSPVSDTALVIPSGWPLTPPAGFSFHSFKLDASAGLTGKGFMRLAESH